jgi:hypothetical protein
MKVSSTIINFETVVFNKKVSMNLDYNMWGGIQNKNLC